MSVELYLDVNDLNDDYRTFSVFKPLNVSLSQDFENDVYRNWIASDEYIQIWISLVGPIKTLLKETTMKQKLYLLNDDIDWVRVDFRWVWSSFHNKNNRYILDSVNENMNKDVRNLVSRSVYTFSPIYSDDGVAGFIRTILVINQ
jgi:hypothetical protein